MDEENDIEYVHFMRGSGMYGATLISQEAEFLNDEDSLTE